MKKVIVFSILALGIYSFSIGQKLEEKERELFSKNHVKTRTNWDYTFKDGKFSMDGKKTTVCSYDKNGRILQIQSFNNKGKVSTLEKFQYDTNGNRTFYERQSLSGEYKKESEYNTENNLIQEYGYDGNANFRTTFKYNDKNRILEITYLIANQVDEKRVYTYTGNQARVEILKNGKNLISKVLLTFNSNNQIIKEQVLTADGKPIESRVLDYNDNGDITKEEKYKDGEFFYRITYDYDANGELSSISEETKAEPKFVKKQYQYDDQGRVTQYKWKRNPDDDYNIKVFKYGDKGVSSEEHTYYPKTNYKLLTKYEYEFY